MARGVARPNSVVGRYTPGHYWSNQWPFREAQGLGPFYDVASLFRNGEEGGWYDPSDLDSMFQDSAGTIPAAINSPVGKRLDKSGNGNHLIQATAASRATLSARYNLVTKSEEIDNAIWGKAGGAASSVPYLSYDNKPIARKFIEDTANSQHVYYLNSGLQVVNADEIVGYAELQYAGRSSVTVWMPNAGFTNIIKCEVDLILGTVTGTGVTGAAVVISADIENLGNDWYGVTVRGRLAAGDSARLACYLNNSSTYVGDGVSGVIATRHQIRKAVDVDGINFPAYQRIDTATDYDTVGFPTYLLYDGIDDGYATAASVDFSGTDKMTVWAGVTKLSDAARGVVFEHEGAGIQRIDIEAPGTTLNSYVVTSGGTLNVSASVVVAAPNTSVLAGIGNIAADIVTLRQNGVQVATSAADQGTGNYSNSTLTAGKKAAGTLPFNGREYGLIIRGAQSTSTEIVQFEDYMAQKTGIAPL